jgi:Holliday junction resolvase RusA-like endonuclease
MIEFFIDPMGKPRMTQRDKWKQRPCVLRYRKFCDMTREALQAFKFDLPNAFSIRFTIEMPASWSAKKRAAMLGAPHQSRPDLDNMIKAVCDAAKKEDSTVYRVHAEKIWGKAGSIKIWVLE